jgi:hypothetical protein
MFYADVKHVYKLQVRSKVRAITAESADVHSATILPFIAEHKP